MTAADRRTQAAQQGLAAAALTGQPGRRLCPMTDSAYLRAGLLPLTSAPVGVADWRYCPIPRLSTRPSAEREVDGHVRSAGRRGSALAVVHDYLTQRVGNERVALALWRA